LHGPAPEFDKLLATLEFADEDPIFTVVVRNRLTAGLWRRETWAK